MVEEIYKIEGPALILAGPGTGKTYNIAKRIKYLIEEKEVNPLNITAITFTTNAAENTKKRISDHSKKELFISIENRPKRICTMHSLGYRIINSHHSLLGLNKEIELINSDKVQNIFMQDAASVLKVDKRYISETIKCRQAGKCYREEELKCGICEEYKKILRICNAIDYNDQILLACNILKENPDLVIKQKFYCQHLLIDEYQDINAGQFELIKLLSDGQLDGLFAVGDDDQSIYSWRGGSPEFIRNFKDHFGEKAKVEFLYKSYRCNKNIIESGISIVKKFDEKHIPKVELEYDNEEGELIKVHNVPSGKREAEIIKSIVKDSDSLKVLILLPNRSYSPLITEELKKVKIPINCLFISPGEGLPFIFTLNKWINNNSDNVSFRECIETYIDSKCSGIPSKKSKKSENIRIRDDILEKIGELWVTLQKKRAKNLWEAIKIMKDSDNFLKKVYEIFENMISCSSNGTVTEFFSEVMKYFSLWSSPKNFLQEINNWVEAIKSTGDTGTGINVTITTFQSAKGLEADYVCVVGLEDGTIPEYNIPPEKIAEQSRLMFVSMTRAKKELHLFHARSRSGAILHRKIFEKEKAPNIKVSCFIEAIPNEYCRTIYHPSKSKSS